MQFRPELSTPPTVEELRAYYEWLKKPQEMRSVAPPPPEGVDDKVWKAMIEATSPPTLSEGVDSVEELLKLADQDDPLAKSRDGPAFAVPSDYAHGRQEGGPEKIGIGDVTQEAAGRNRSSWFPLFCLFASLFVAAVLFTYRAAILLQGEHKPRSVAPDKETGNAFARASVPETNPQPTIASGNGAVSVSPAKSSAIGSPTPKPINLDMYNLGADFLGRAVATGANADLDSSIALFTERSKANLKKGHYDEAIDDFTEAIRLDPKCAVAFAGRGAVYAVCGAAIGIKSDNDKAIADFTEAIRLDANNAERYRKRAMVYGNMGDNDKATANFTEAIRLDAKNAEVYRERAEAYEKNGDFEKAKLDNAEAAKLAPDQERKPK